MRNKALQLLTSLLLASCPVLADDNDALTTDQRVGEGLMLMLKGDKQAAWPILMAEAKKGNATAMFHLGNLMLKSPEDPDHIHKAQKFFTAAAARGHKGSEALLKQVTAALNTASSSKPTIAGMSGLPTTEQIAEAKRRISAHTAQAVRFTGFVLDEPKLKISAFAENNADSISRLSSIIDSAKAQFSEAIGVDFYIIVDPQSWNSSQTQIIRSSAMPQEGFMPDLGGQMAAQLGVKRAPAIVLQSQNERPRVVSDPSSLITEISRLL
ncbi:sel1 repeat family protein (plasmid) [Halopseudomonas sp. SMJS2]|uniref:sel1 repeat family protein n=1 Tax=Halopseudomonas sp. SMJS2 TaxID=3041098 RepID=UPI002452D48F|nr:sel1 repeat family protein [Halopseudomonas sp. SMJS2]WGK63516.1 sel1 repeat family protein [Halopseudomonas sp. SMJS2]